MPRMCTICGKGPKRAASRSHSNIRTLRRQMVNIQTIQGRTLCTRCLKRERNQP